MSYELFKNKFLEDESKKGYDKNKLKPALNKFMDSLRNIEACRVVERNIAHSEMCTNINIRMNNYSSYYNKKDKCLKVLVSLPLFDAIYKKTSKHEAIQDRIQLLGMLIQKYVVNAFTLNVITAVSIMTGDYYTFYNSSIAQHNFKNKQDADDYISNIISNSYSNSINQSTDIPYIDKINCLDPYVNRVVYYYLAFKYNQNADLDFNRCCLNFDNFIDSIIKTIKRNNKIGISDRDSLNEEMFKILNISDIDVQKSIKQAYIIRCEYTAHSAVTSWWNGGDMFEEYSDKWEKYITQLLKSFLDYINTSSNYNRSIESWHDWIESNLLEIYDDKYVAFIDKIESV